jgi:hypothetical protein
MHDTGHGAELECQLLVVIQRPQSPHPIVLSLVSRVLVRIDL